MKATAYPRPLVSVIVPACNAAPYIQQTVSSVLEQTYTNLEVLVVDDGSTDETSAVVRSISAEDSRVRLLHQANAGVAAARNYGIREARGEFIAPLDADDIWFPRKLERQVESMVSAGSSVGLVYTWVAVIDSQGHIIESSVRNLQGDVLVDLVFSNFIGCASDPLIRRTCLEAVGGYDPWFREQEAQGSEDWDLYLRLAEQCEFRVVPEFLASYRRTPDSMSRQYMSMERSHRLIMERIRRRHPEFPPRIFRWSSANYCAYLVSKSYAKGRYWQSARYVLRSIWNDPLRLVSSQVYLTLLKCAARASTEPFIDLLWEDRATWDTYLKGLKTSSRPQRSREEVISGIVTSQPVPLFKRLHEKRMSNLKRRLHVRPWTARKTKATFSPNAIECND
jgi:glycosyltransferase involved in cell wall biosynthesis